MPSSEVFDDIDVVDAGLRDVLEARGLVLALSRAFNDKSSADEGLWELRQRGGFE